MGLQKYPINGSIRQKIKKRKILNREKRIAKFEKDKIRLNTEYL